MGRATQLADAYEHIARTNHYMVGITETVTPEELDSAEQILITRQNAGKQSGRAYRRLNLALDLVEQARRASFAT